MAIGGGGGGGTKGGGSGNGFQAMGLSDPVFRGIVRMGFRVSVFSATTGDVPKQHGSVKRVLYVDATLQTELTHNL